jgi:hypothetical protein
MKLNKNTYALLLSVTAIAITLVIGYLIVLKTRYHKLEGGFVYDKWTDKIYVPKR